MEIKFPPATITPSFSFFYFIHSILKNHKIKLKLLKSKALILALKACIGEGMKTRVSFSSLMLCRTKSVSPFNSKTLFHLSALSCEERIMSSLKNIRFVGIFFLKIKHWSVFYSPLNIFGC